MKSLYDFYQKIKSKLLIVIFISIISFLGGYFITDCINYFSGTYQCEFTSSVIIDDSLLTAEKLQEIKDSDNKYCNIDIDDMLEHNGIYLESEGDTYTITTGIRYYDTIFVKSTASISTRAKMFLKDLLINNYSEQNIVFSNPVDIITTNQINPYLIGGITLISIDLITIVAMIIFKKNDAESEPFYDNVITFSTPFHREYWKSCLTFLSSPRKITATAMLFALQLLSKTLILPSGFANLGLSFGFIFFSIICIIAGPLAGLLIGCLSDVLGFFLFDSSGTSFFIGYVFQAMISGFIYGIMLYRTKLSYCRILITRILIALISNVLIGSLCWGFIMGYNWTQTFAYLLLFSLPKNLVYLIPQSILLYLIVKAVVPILSRYHYIEEKIAKRIALI